MNSILLLRTRDIIQLAHLKRAQFLANAYLKRSLLIKRKRRVRREAFQERFTLEEQVR
jgi:hypothetical protein